MGKRDQLLRFLADFTNSVGRAHEARTELSARATQSLPMSMRRNVCVTEPNRSSAVDGLSALSDHSVIGLPASPTYTPWISTI